MDDKYTTVEVQISEDTAALLDEAAQCAGVTRDQAASVITYFAFRRFIEDSATIGEVDTHG